MRRSSTSLTYALVLVGCAGPDIAGSEPKATSEAPSGSSTTGTSGGSSSSTDVSTDPAPTTGNISSGSTSHDVTSESTSHDDTSGSTSTTSTGEGTTQNTETGGEGPFKVGLALKSLCSPDQTSVCGVTLDDKMVCWGSIDDPSYQLPPGKVKAVSPHCFTAVLENGELHRLWNFPSKPLSLPKGPFVLAGGEYPYGCAMAANNEMTCWVAEGYEIIEEPPPGPFLTLNDALEVDCQMCGINDSGSLVCWKKPVLGGDWERDCNGLGWTGGAKGTYTKFIGSIYGSVRAMNDMGQLIWFYPSGNDSLYVDPAFASGGFVEADVLVGLRQSGELLYFENSMGDGVPVVPGAYTTYHGDQNGGCAIRQADSRVVCWGQGDYGQFDPPTE